MANLSDAFGNIIVQKVGKEFLEFLRTVQDKDAYYTLVSNLDDLIPDDDGDIEFDISDSGRWAYENNIDGYLNGEWMQGEDDKKAYDKFIAAIKEKDGVVSIEYQDSDTAMDWMGSGYAELSSNNGEISYSKDFTEERITIERFAEQQGETQEWALEYIYGDEVADKYYKYVDEWKKTHDFIEGREEPACPEEWYNNEYQED